LFDEFQHDIVLFGAIVLGNLKGAIKFIHTSYRGKKITDFSDEELKEAMGRL
jgi:hypothetical protein